MLLFTHIGWIKNRKSFFLQIIREIRGFNQKLVKKGVRVLPVRMSADRVQILLKHKGYDCRKAAQCICRLVQNLHSDPDFPHEIGLFLGYPAEDVKGFIENKAACSKCSGCWKVYGDEQVARILFKKYKKCTEIYCRKWKSGVAVEQLTITI